MNENYLGWKANGIGRMLFFMFIQSVVYFSIIFLAESSLGMRLRYCLTNCFSRNHLTGMDNEMMSDEITIVDDDVQKEEQRVINKPVQFLTKTDLVVMKNVTKRYGNFTAVDDIGVGIPGGECFGLLGINGAGKSTTFKMLTGDEMITSGYIYINGVNVKNNLKKVRELFSSMF